MASLDAVVHVYVAYILKTLCKADLRYITQLKQRILKSANPIPNPSIKP